MPPKAHAKLSPSAAHRWMNCPPSANLEAGFPDRTTTFAEEGTLAHKLAELTLRYGFEEIHKRTYTIRVNKLKEDPLFNKEMSDYIDLYAILVNEQFSEVKASCPDAQIFFEQQFDLSAYIPGGFGTGDVVIIADDLMQVIDLKYGKGVGVSAVENPQLRIYALGALMEYSMLYDIQRVKTTIIQPRLDNVSSEELSVANLLAWGKDVLRPAAKLAEAGEGEFMVGEHCRFCKAFATCRAQKDYQLELAKYDFADAPLLDDNEIGEVLTRVDALVKWAEAVKDYAYKEAVHGSKQWPGWKLVEGRSTRKYVDEDAVAEKLLKSGWEEVVIYKPRELQGITAMEKILGKKGFAELLGGLVIKPEGKPVLVPESDKRPALDLAEHVKDEFKDI